MLKRFSVLIIICLLTIGSYIYYQQTTLNKGGIVISPIYPSYDIEDLTNISNVIVKGSVESISEARWNNKENRQPSSIKSSDLIYKEVKLNVTDVFKGNITSDNKITIRSFGGKINNYSFTYMNDEDKYSKGEDLIAFLIYDDTPFNKENSKDYFIVLGSDIQGTYKIKNNSIASNSSESIGINELKEKIQYHILNPKPVIKGKSDL